MEILSLTTIGVKVTTIVAKRTTLLMEVTMTTSCLMQKTNVLCSCRQDGILVLMIDSSSHEDFSRQHGDFDFSGSEEDVGDY
mmetsp:Transcript_35938/g.86863  ORF Transcript_35938/g.86863 Transcript_35938/m.86863 type:complete len:82 (+) Transcript_35938:457-702(+)